MGEALSLRCLAGLKEIKTELRITDTARDEEIAALADRVAEVFEDYADRKFVYRGDLETANAIVAAQSWANGSLTLAGQPAGIRSIHVEWSKAEAMAGSALVTGTLLGAAVTETFVCPSEGGMLRGTKLFDAITSVVVSGAPASAGTVNFGTVLPYEEYHSFDEVRRAEIYLLERPVLVIGEFCEDVGRAYAASTRLTGNDYALSNEMGKVIKTKGMLGIDFPEDYFFRFPQKLPTFAWGPRVLRIKYTAGFKYDALRSNVPGSLRDGYLQQIAVRWREADRKMQGTSSTSDAAGGTSRFSKGDLLEHVGKMLDGWMTRSTTGERAA